MTTRRNEPPEEEFTSRLIALADAIAGDTPLPGDAATVDDFLGDQLKDARACLERIDRYRRIVQGTDVAGGETAEADDWFVEPRVGGERIGRFEIRREVGRGGYGVVFLANDPTLGREVALKVPRPEALVSPELRRRFLREGKAAAALDHPHIVPVYEAGTTGGVCYIAAAYCDGPTLSEWIRAHESRPVAWRTSARFVSMLAYAVQHAHNRGVLHRDLKPGNVLLDAQTGEGADETKIEGLDDFVPRITDFGLAKMLGGGSDETRSTAIVGTPSYMAPEQAAGNVGAIREATDVYGLGAILYEMLTGVAPFSKGTDVATLQAIQYEEVRAPGRVAEAVPKELEAICLKCLEKDPSKRYATAMSLADDLERYLAGVPVTAQRIGQLARGLRWCRRNPLAATLGMTAAVLLASIATVASVGYVQVSRAFERESRQRGITQEALTEAETQRQLADENAQLAATQQAIAEAHLQDATQAVDDYFTTISESRLLNVPGLQPLRRELLESAVDYYRRFIENRQDDDTMRGELAAAHVRLGEMSLELGSLSEAEASLVQGAEIYSRLIDGSGERTGLVAGKIEALLRLCDVRWSQDASEEALVLSGDALALAERLSDIDPTNPEHRFLLGGCLSTRARSLQRSNDRDAASDHYSRAIESLEALVEDAPEEEKYLNELATTHSNRAQLWNDGRTWNAEAAKYEMAVSDAARAIEMRQLLCDMAPERIDRRASLAISYLNHGDTLRMGGNAAAAGASLAESRRIAEGLVMENPTVVQFRQVLTFALQHRSLLMIETGQHEPAMEELRVLLDVREALMATFGDVGDLPAFLAINEADLAYLEMCQSSRDAAECIDVFQAAADALGASNFRPHLYLGAAYYRAGQLAEARKALSRTATMLTFGRRLNRIPAWRTFANQACASYYLAMVERELGNDEAAAEALAQGKAAQDEFADAVNALPGGEPLQGFTEQVLVPLGSEASRVVEGQSAKEAARS